MKILTLMVLALGFALTSIGASATSAHDQSVIKQAWLAYTNSPYNPQVNANWRNVKGTVVKIGTVPAPNHNAMLGAALVCFHYDISANGLGSTPEATCVYHIADPTGAARSVQWRPATKMSELVMSMRREGFVSTRS